MNTKKTIPRAGRRVRCPRSTTLWTTGAEYGHDLPLIWFVIIVFSTMMYVVMDGFDLGIGILFPWVKESGDRDLMMNTVAPGVGRQ